jgi:hypothetical protein
MNVQKQLRVATIIMVCLATAGCFGLMDTRIANSAQLNYPIVDTGQSDCYDDQSQILCSSQANAFYGQDAQYNGDQPAYADNGDGTVTDLVTGLMWQQNYSGKMTYSEAVAGANSFSLAGYIDWRLPTIKELYSLMDFNGVDSGDASGTGMVPFLDTETLGFAYGNTSNGERLIDSQWVTSTTYVATVMGNQGCFFGVNFADGRIKCYPTMPLGNNGYFVRYVRESSYGQNNLLAHGDGTVTDISSGLMWQESDSGQGMDWDNALGYCEDLSLAGHDDWRLPNAKELHSIVDYERSPDTTDSAAIDPLFGTSEIVNEAGVKDYPFFWTSTTHARAGGIRSNTVIGTAAVYIAFGRALGFMNNRWLDVHGAGAQRSDPKSGNPDDYPITRGPQGDVNRVFNYARCVRDV